MYSQDEPDTSNAAIGARIVAVRVARDLSQGALAQALGISVTRLSNYERGNRTFPPELLARLWRVTGATTDFILMNRKDGLPSSLRKLLDQQSGEENVA